MTWQFLKDPDEKVSYARVVGFLSIIGNLIWRMYQGCDGINSWPAAVSATCGCWTGLLIWACEVWRNAKGITLKLGDKEYGAKIGV